VDIVPLLFRRQLVTFRVGLSAILTWGVLWLPLVGRGECGLVEASHTHELRNVYDFPSSSPQTE
jgi:hypothetical protein